MANSVAEHSMELSEIHIIDNNEVEINTEGSRDGAADDIRDKESSLRFGDYARVARGPFEGYFAAIIEEADDELKIQYFKEKHGKPHGKYWVLAESENEKEWSPRSDLEKIQPDIDWRGRFALSEILVCLGLYL